MADVCSLKLSDCLIACLLAQLYLFTCPANMSDGSSYLSQASKAHMIKHMPYSQLTKHCSLCLLCVPTSPLVHVCAIQLSFQLPQRKKKEKQHLIVELQSVFGMIQMARSLHLTIKAGNQRTDVIIICYLSSTIVKRNYLLFSQTYLRIIMTGMMRFRHGS